MALQAMPTALHPWAPQNLGTCTHASADGQHGVVLAPFVAFIAETGTGAPPCPAFPRCTRENIAGKWHAANPAKNSEEEDTATPRAIQGPMARRGLMEPACCWRKTGK